VNKLSSILILSTVVVSFGCGSPEVTTDQPNEAIKIVEKSIEAHGGWQAWEQMRNLNYTKEISMFDSTGMLESKTTQVHSYYFKPRFEGKITWRSDNNYQIQYENDNVLEFINNTPQLEEASLAEAKSILQSSHYVLFQPWKLLDPGVKLIYLGKDKLDDSTTVEVIKLVFNGDDDNSDKWWFYVSESTGLLAGYLVKHEDRISFIRNVSYDSTTSLVFPHHRTSQFVSDTTRSNKLLRAEYYYENFEMNSN